MRSCSQNTWDASRGSVSPQISQHLVRMYDAILIRKPFGILLLSYFLKRYLSNRKVQPRLRNVVILGRQF